MNYSVFHCPDQPDIIKAIRLARLYTLGGLSLKPGQRAILETVLLSASQRTQDQTDDRRRGYFLFVSELI